MLNQESMTLVQSLLVSGLGLSVVLAELSVLAISIKIFTYFISLFSKDGAAAAPVMAAENPGAEQDFAIIMAVMKEELNGRHGEYRIKSIHEVKA